MVYTKYGSNGEIKNNILGYLLLKGDWFERLSCGKALVLESASLVTMSVAPPTHPSAFSTSHLNLCATIRLV